MATRHTKQRDFKGLAFIRDSVLYRGHAPTLQAVSDHLGYRSRRSASLLIERLIKNGFLERTAVGNLRILTSGESDPREERTVEVPLVGTAPCGLPLLAEENIEAMIAVSQRIARPGSTYFLVRARGSSMDQAGIADGNLVLVRQQQAAQDGDRIVALIDDSATIKEFRRSGDKVVLMPRSSDKRHQPIILDRDFLVQGIVVDSIPYPSE